MKLLLTGATGFVGRNTILSALRSGRYEKIFVPVRSESRLRQQFAEEGFESLPTQVIALHSETGFAVPEETCDEVIHCAGVLFERDPQAYRVVNVEATVDFIARLKGNPRILVISSQSAGGAAPAGFPSRMESHSDEPITWYGESKREMEQRIIEQFSHHSLMILRPPMILGPRDAASLPLFRMAQASVRIKPALHTKYYSWIAVDDLVVAFFSTLDGHALWEAEHRKFYVASPDSITDWQLISSAAAVMNTQGITLPLPQPVVQMAAVLVDAIPKLRTQVPSLTKDRAREIWPSRMLVDASAFAGRFKWNATKNLHDTLQVTAEWYKQRGML